MAKKSNNTRTLVIVLIVLLGIFFLLQIRTNKKESTLKRDLVSIDTANVTSIYLYPQTEKGKELAFAKTDKGWRIKEGKKEAPVERATIRNILASTLHIRPKQLAAVGESSWKKYDVTDSLATRLKIMEGSKKTLDLYIGKFSVSRGTQNSYPNYGGGVSGVSYVRSAGGKAVYAVDGFLSMTYNQGFNAWRNHNFMVLHKDDIDKITFTYPADTGFVAVKDSTSHWSLGSEPADSAKIAGYLSKLLYRRYSNFVDDYVPPEQSDYQIMIEGKNMTPLVVKAFRDDKYHFVMHSSQNPETYFADKDSTVFKMLFIPKNKLSGKKTCIYLNKN